MTEGKADDLLKEYKNEIFIAENYGEAYYAAVVKKTRDFKIENDYFIRLGIKNQLKPVYIGKLLTNEIGLNILKKTNFNYLFLEKIEANIETIKSSCIDRNSDYINTFFSDDELDYLTFDSNNIKELTENELKYLGYSKTLIDAIKSGIVIIENSGKISLLDCNKPEYNPSLILEDELTGGITITNANDGDSVGTLGGFFKFTDDNNDYFFTNAHVVSNQNTIRNCPESKQVIHTNNPNPSTCGIREIGNIFWFCYNDYLDAAIIKLYKGESISTKSTRCNKINFGEISDVKLFDEVYKCGRSTEYTCGTVISTNATFYIRDDKKFFYNQIMTTNMSFKGDSGSLLTTKQNTVGLIFAGDNIKHTVSFANHLNMIFKTNTNIKKCKPKLSNITFKTR